MNTQTLVEKKQYCYLNLLITSWCMLGALDMLKDTNAYRQKLKNLVNQLEPELTKMIDEDLDLLWGVDDPALYNLQGKIKLFLEKMATQKTENIAGLGELLDQFEQMPELVLHRNGIKIVKSGQDVIKQAAG